MDSQQSNAHNPDSVQPFRTEYPYHPAPSEQFNYLNQDSENSFNTIWDAGRYTPDNQEPINGFNTPSQHWPHGALQSSNYTTPNYNVTHRPYDQTFSRIPDNYDIPPNFVSHSQQTSTASAFDPRSNSYTQVPPNITPQFNYNGQRLYQAQQAQSQTISPQALQHYPTHNSQAVPHKARQPQQTAAVPASSNFGRVNSASAPQPPIDSQGWRSLALKLPVSSARRALLVRDAAELSSISNVKKFQGFAFLSSGSIDVVATKAHLPKYTKRRSKNEVQKLLLQEKGTGPWNLAREPVRKKLKRGSVSFTTPRPSSSAGSTPTADSISSTESSSESESDGDSEYSSDSDDGSRVDETSPLPKTKPTDPDKATEYDITKAVWAKRSVALSGAVIRAALSDSWEIFKHIRDQWKSDMARLQQADAQKNKEQAAQARSRADGSRRLLESCIRLTLKHGHKDIVERLGENPSMSAVLSSFLIDRTKENEYAGRFITSILELMVQWVKVDRETLEKTKLDKLLPKLVKKGDEKVKSLAQQVLDKSGITLSKLPADGKHVANQPSKDSATPASTVDGTRTIEGSPSLKRPRQNDTAASVPNKKQLSSDGAVSSPNKTVSKPISGLEKRRQQAAKADSKAGSKVTSSTVPEKVKTNHIAAKPSAFFSSLQSASKKPSATKISASSAKGKDGKENNALEAKGSATAGSTSKPAFSFAETMANLNKPKNDVPSKSEDARPPETEDEKRKRLRKESRRKMRVSFKADDELVEIRTFVHDPEEELGHDDSMVRDVGDSRGEGQMLKMHKDLELMDEDEEDYEPTEELPTVWHEPTLIDFNVIDREQRSQSLITRGGLLEVRSHERTLQEEREASKLLVVYSSLADIPPSPNEPSEQPADDNSSEALFGQPGEETKAREAQYYASRTAPSYTPLGSVAGQSSTPDISALLKIINSQQQPQQPPLQSQPQPTSAQPNGLEAIFAQFANNSNGQQPQAHMQISAQPAPVPPVYSVPAAVASMSVTNTAQPALPAFAPSSSNQQPSLQAILAQFHQQPPAQMQGYGYPTSYQADNDRKRQANFDDQSNIEHSYIKGKRQKGEEKKFFNPPRYRDPCKFWMEGKCTKGEACTFLHGEKPPG